MKKILVFIVFLLIIPVYLIAQQDDKLSREEKKELKRKAEIAENSYLDSLIESRRFILEADVMYDKYGQRANVNQMLNFVKIDSLQGIFQFGSNNSFGRNGVGGNTFKGNITKYEVNKKGTGKGLTYYIEVFMMTRSDLITIKLEIVSLNSAKATVQNNRGDKVILSGEIVSIENSRTFKGYTN